MVPNHDRSKGSKDDVERSVLGDSVRTRIWSMVRPGTAAAGRVGHEWLARGRTATGFPSRAGWGGTSPASAIGRGDHPTAGRDRSGREEPAGGTAAALAVVEEGRAS